MARGGDYAATPRSRQALLPPLHLHICRPASPALLQVEDALVYEQSTDEEGEEETDEQEEQEEEEAEEEEVAPPAQAARTATGANPRRARRGRARPSRVVAASLSELLAGAPRLVDLLIEQDSIRCTTLICRDALNLQQAAGGGVELAPLWDALAMSIG